MEVSDSDIKGFIEDYLSHSDFFSCVILYDRAENLAWYAALNISEKIKNYFESRTGEQINIHLTLNLTKIIENLAKIGEHDVLLLSINNQAIKSISAYLVSEVLTEKRSLIFISKDDNTLIRPFQDITDVLIHVSTLEEGLLNCIVNIHERGERKLKLTLPSNSLINKYRDLRTSSLREAISRQVPELNDR